MNLRCRDWSQCWLCLQGVHLVTLRQRKISASDPLSTWWPGRDDLIATDPSKGWFTYLRFYGPTEAFFDKSWKMTDFEKIGSAGTVGSTK
jgi:hypothetical protein